MSLEAITWAFAQSVRPAGKKFVLVALANYADANGFCYPSQAEIADLTGQSDRAVRGHLSQLEEAKYIRRRARFGPDGMQITDGYLLAVEQLKASSKKKRASRISRAEESATPGGKKQQDGAEESATDTWGVQMNRGDSSSGAGAPVSGGSVGSAHWTQRACDSWQQHMGGAAPGGRIGSALKALVEKYGEAEVLTAWDTYLASHVAAGTGQYANPQDFATRYGYFKTHGVKMPRNGNGRTRTTDPQDYGDPTQEVRWTR